MYRLIPALVAAVVSLLVLSSGGILNGELLLEERTVQEINSVFPSSGPAIQYVIAVFPGASPPSSGTNSHKAQAQSALPTNHTQQPPKTTNSSGLSLWQWLQNNLAVIIAVIVAIITALASIVATLITARYNRKTLNELQKINMNMKRAYGK